MADSSRGSWITKDDPKMVSSRHKDFYEDILEARRKESDILFSLRTRETPAYKYNEKRTNDAIKLEVLNSDRVKYAVEQVAKERDVEELVVKAEVQTILDEMAHSLNMGAVRGFALGLTKALKQLYRRVYVNEGGIYRLRHLMQEYPVLLMPTHRSYMDFLMMSYVMYIYELPLPVIAAAMDFMGMNFFGWLLRNSGAFYIRRTFGGDQLYWAVFTEYVQTQICNGDFPMEFFVEGTRSRTSKSYSPKLGMLSAALEPYFKALVPDIMVIPVSMSYDRVLEERLYAYELLGVPKPKESTSGLLKARSVLSEDYGSIHVHFGEPISIRQFSAGKIDRISHSLAPRYIASLSADEQELVHKFGHHVVLAQLKHMVISPWALISAVLLQNKEGILVKQLVKEVEWLKRQASNLGAYIDWPGQEVAETVIKSNIEFHKNLVTINEKQIVELLRPEQTTEGRTAPASQQDRLMESAAQQIMVSLYRNQLAHVFIRVAMVTIPINASNQDSMSLDELFEKYVFLEKLLSKDFIFYPGNTKQDFDNALATLTHTCGVVVETGHLIIKQSISKYTTFFSQMYEPFLLGYWVLCQCLLSMTRDPHGKPVPKEAKTLCKEAQALSARLLREGIVKHQEILSLDMMNNGIKSFLKLGALAKETREGKSLVCPNMLPLSKVSEEIAKLMEVPALRVARINVETKTVTINSKL
ncbi:dihydroxyacetone phosphate acyltransferase-like [Liolophura sinensis]|uniref:dihydroxyacetone phosphate acyltransferase-like n=1 Tax=Liolophura sinensis TaxID=3198878 RepID=UPI003158E773